MVRAVFSFLLARMGYFSVVQITRSSAKRALETFRSGGRSFRNIKKRVQLSADP